MTTPLFPRPVRDCCRCRTRCSDMREPKFAASNWSGSKCCKYNGTRRWHERYGVTWIGLPKRAHKSRSSIFRSIAEQRRWPYYGCRRVRRKLYDIYNSERVPAKSFGLTLFLRSNRAPPNIAKRHHVQVVSYVTVFWDVCRQYSRHFSCRASEKTLPRKEHLSLSAITTKELIKAHGLHGSDFIRLVDVQFSPMKITTGMVSIAHQSKNCTAAAGTYQNHPFETNRVGPRQENYSNEESNYECQNQRKPNMQQSEYNDLPSSSNEFSASIRATYQPQRPVFRAGLGIQGLIGRFLKQKRFSASW